MGVVDFTKARGPFGPLGFKRLPLLGHLQNLLLPLYVNVSLLHTAVQQTACQYPFTINKVRLDLIIQ